MIKAKLTVAAGGLLHSSAGEVALGSAHENSVGTLPPSLNAGLITLNFDGGGAAPCCCAEALPIPAKTKAERTASERIGFILSIVFSLIRLSFLAVNGGRCNMASPRRAQPLAELYYRDSQFTVILAAARTGTMAETLEAI